MTWLMGFTDRTNCDFLVIGSGLAGLAFALKMADHGHVLIASKAQAPATNSSMAQGGIAAVIGGDDSFDDHVRDTLVAGAGLCKESTVRTVVEAAPGVIAELVKWGVRFDAKDADGTQFDLTREGGHSFRRIVHVQDHTGQEVHAKLLEKAKAHPSIEIREDLFGIDLILDRQGRAIGMHGFDRKNWRGVDVFSRMTLLATGGAGKVYLYTSNWSGATGDGIAMAYRAGATIANLEFMQFHPTCLYHPNARNFLITEAIRGEGGELINAAGDAFMKRYHPLGSLAPRDIVARSIDAEMKKTGEPCMYLDISTKPEDFIAHHFPVIQKTCLQFGIDITKEPIPIVPAAHYLCGGVVTDLDGQTSIPSLYAAGETACTGLHGANRLASNSLLECLVFADRAAKHVMANNANMPKPEPIVAEWSLLGDRSPDEEQVAIAHMWDEIRRLMWNYVGIVRSNRRLEAAQARLNVILNEIERDHRLKLHPDAIELRNIALVADLTVRQAMMRKESRGIHWNVDYPKLLEGPAQDTILSRTSPRD